ncbi:leucine-rich repeat-containing protein 40-like isoform X1 [Asterias rubens]|uniref:leucine-rich repeat-containing protein 40-like isoform X1 n=1 Tax=Asterias rubens TaxID=7604 RepID=UPI001455A29E|nr:leucine-rich repeat-containing protein 40-like isoform X1 [Asterias rubens]
MEEKHRGTQNGRAGSVTLDFSSTNLSSFEISKSDLASCTTLILNYNEICELPADIGDTLHSLSSLLLIGNQLKELPESLGKLVSLKELNLSENGLISLPKTLGFLTHLAILKLVGNELKNLPEGFGGLESLRSLELDENFLTSLPESFGLVESLEVLEACDNALVELPASFGNLRHLQVLNLSNNRLETLPDSFGSLQCLKMVDLSGNKIKALMPEFKSCHCLKKLYLTGNRLTVLPVWIGELPKLQELSLRDNQLEHKALPESFGETSRNTLRHLDISGNFQTELPSTLGLLVHLDFLHMGSVIGELERQNFQNGNWIARFPENFGNLHLLRELHAEENQLNCLPENFGDLASLEFLDLGQNMLRQLPESFCELKSLQVCLLSKNHIECLPKEFGKLGGLQVIRLDCNKLTDLPESFMKLTNIELLDLFDNRLTRIPSVLKYLTKLTRLDLDLNKFDMPALSVPNLTRPNQYPSGKSATSDNWRTRARADEVAIAEQQLAEVVLDEMSSQNSINTVLNNSIISQALRNKASIWQSHEGTKIRESRTDTILLEKRMSRRHQKYSYSSDANSEDPNELDDCSSDGSHDEQGTGSNIVTQEEIEKAEENWDEDLIDISCFGSDRLYRHPQDMDKTVDADSCFVFTPSDEHVPNLPNASINDDAEDGQFDDAD